MDEEQPLSEQMKTMMAWRVSESKYKFFKDLWHLFLIFLGMAIGFGTLGFFQWWNCTGRDPSKTFMECMRYDFPTKKGK